MITSIHVAGVATYKTSAVFDGLSKVNFIFGFNGSGKTTVSRIIADEGSFPTCSVQWAQGTKLQAMVYNRDFVERNINQPSELKGVFTLGETQIDTQAKIADAKKIFETAKNKKESLAQELAKKELALRDVEDSFQEKCWEQKKKFDDKFRAAFAGYKASMKRFKNKILEEIENNSATLLPLADLLEKAESVFSETPEYERIIKTIEMRHLTQHESDPILQKRVIGKKDVDIAAMINRLGNSDWVRAGKDFYHSNGTICPFCQQTTTEAFKQSLDEYFDETFTRDSKAIDHLVEHYRRDAEGVQEQLTTLLDTPYRFLDVDRLKARKTLFDAKIIINLQRLAEKKREVSQSIELESVHDLIVSIETIIDAANRAATEHNTTIKNRETVRAALIAQAWKFILNELREDTNKYAAKRGSLESNISSIKSNINLIAIEQNRITTELQELEKQITSIQPTIDAMNQLLSSFGFQGFLIAKGDGESSYKIVRSDGIDAKHTLSEGEKTFISFLYFYHLIKGSSTSDGITKDRVIVFDDPVSSLDSEILFIVATLISSIFDETRKQSPQIRQVFVLTHNTYFHKEITFHKKGSKNKYNKFWIIRKTEHGSSVEKCDHNPIKNSYALLWDDVRKQDRSNLTIQNTLRRIVEGYFGMVGIDSSDIIKKFDGSERIICKSLFSWVNDGSHSVHDDMYVDDAPAGKYLAVFLAIFEKMGHRAHYDMMMGAG